MSGKSNGKKATSTSSVPATVAKVPQKAVEAKKATQAKNTPPTRPLTPDVTPVAPNLATLEGKDGKQFNSSLNTSVAPKEAKKNKNECPPNEELLIKASDLQDAIVDSLKTLLPELLNPLLQAIRAEMALKKRTSLQRTPKPQILEDDDDDDDEQLAPVLKKSVDKRGKVALSSTMLDVQAQAKELWLIVALLARRYVLTENLHASKQDGANWFTALYGKDDPNALRIQTIAPFCDFALAHALGAKVKDTAKNMRATLIKDMGFAVARNINPISARRLKHYLVSLLDSLVVPRGEKPSLAATFEAGEGDLRMMQNRWFAVPKQTREYLVHNLTAIRECNYSYSKLLPASFEGF